MGIIFFIEIYDADEEEEVERHGYSTPNSL